MGGEAGQRAFAYYGSRGGGLVHTPRQFRVDGTVDIGLLGESDEPDAFRVKLRGSNPLGRSDVRLEVEVDLLGTPFDGGGTIVSTPANTGDPATTGFVDFDEVFSGFLVPGESLPLAGTRAHRQPAVPALALVRSGRKQCRRDRLPHRVHRLSVCRLDLAGQPRQGHQPGDERQRHLLDADRSR